MNGSKLAVLALLLTLLVFPIVIVYANVPTIISITRRTDSSNTLIDVKVSHADPTAAHYISQITLDLDGATKTFTDITKATTTEVTYTLNIGATNPKTIKAQATCIIHGPSAWYAEGGTTGSTGGNSYGVPAYPIEAIIMGIILSVATLLLIKKR
jgi:desulfoferrodoxin (superoxide reductase-like protein)